MTDYIGSEQPYYAKHGKVWKSAIRELGANGGTRITMDFPVCAMHDAAAGQEVLVATLMNRGDIADELVEALKALIQAVATEADASHSISGNMGARLTDARAVVAKADAIP